MSTSERRYDIDWLRVIAIGLLIIYHISIAFQPWGIFIGFIQNNDSLEGLWIPMAMLNVWRIPLLFFVSGMGVCFAIRRRSWKQLLKERTKRILLPFIFGIFCIVPLHILLLQKFYHQDLTYLPSAGHLWFLGNIFIYVVALSPVFFFLKRNKNGRIDKWIKALFSSSLGLIIIVAAFILETMLVRPESYEMYAMTLHGFFLGLLAFLFGFLSVHAGNSFWQNLKKWRWLLLASAVLLYMIRILAFDMKSPDYMMSTETCVWIFAIFGFASKYLNRPSRTLAYLSQGAYPIYILHMVFLYLGSHLIFPLEVSGEIKFIVLILFTVSGCLILYEFVIRRIKVLRLLFGLKA